MKEILLGLLLLAFFWFGYYLVCCGERYFEKLKRNALNCAVYDTIDVSECRLRGN